MSFHSIPLHMSDPLRKLILRNGKWEEFHNELDSKRALPTVPEGERIVCKPGGEWDTTDLECGVDFIGSFANENDTLSYCRERERERERLENIRSSRRNAKNTLVYYTMEDLHRMKDAHLHLIGKIFNKYTGDKWLNDEFLSPLATDIMNTFVDVLHLIPYQMKEHNP